MSCKYGSILFFIIIFCFYACMEVTDPFSEPETIFIAGGTYIMGDADSSGWSDERPAHSVTLDNFYMGQYEISHQEYIYFLNQSDADSNCYLYGYELMDFDDCDCAVCFWDSSFVFRGSSWCDTASSPVIEVTWHGAAAYCNWLSGRTGRTPCYDFRSDTVICDFSADGYRLPTEAEWEYAARSGGKEGSVWSGTSVRTELDHYAWYFSISNYMVHASGLLQSNESGLYDMSGNAWEWCHDYYNAFYYSGSESENPGGPQSGKYRIIRGGSWYDEPSLCRTRERSFADPGESLNNLGFRIVRR